MQNTQENLCRLADHLLQNRTKLIDDWRDRAMHDELLPTLNTLGRKEFLDHIPHVLDVLDQQMRSYHDASLPELAEKKEEKMEIHGLSRWQQGFSVTEVVRDWNHLRCAILDAISTAVEANPDWVTEALSEALGILADLISDGVNSSVSKFEEIRQAEARSHALDLHKTIDELQEVINSQSKRHRETYHDLRGHLGILASLTNALRHRDGLEQSLKNLYEPLEEGLARSLELLENVKLHSALEAKQETLEICGFNASSAIHSILQPYKLLANETGIDFMCDGPENFEIESDPQKFARIVQNLMHNALKFTVSGKIKVTWGQNGQEDHWVLRIQNSGTFSPVRSAVPIAKKLVVASKVNPVSRSESSINARKNHFLTSDTNGIFRSTDLADDRDTQVGEGIGLSIAKRLSDLLGGRLSVESDADDYGVSAILHLPISSPVKTSATGT